MFVVVNAFMYNQILSDGDSSMFAALRKLNHYGADHPVIKLDRVNHAEKRMGTSLRKLLKHQKLGGGPNHDLAGINIQQRLTGNKGVRLYDYYGHAICNHAGDVGAMTNNIWTFLQMTLMQSEDDDRVRRAEPSSEEHTTTVMNASTIGKQACSVGP